MNFLIFTLFIINSSFVQQIERDVKEVYKKNLPYVVSLNYSNLVVGGVVYDSTGLIVTSLPFPQFEDFNVVDFKRDTFKGKMIYWDEITHLGFLKGNLKVKNLKKAYKVEEGDFVFIIGNALGVRNILWWSVISKNEGDRVYIQGDLSPGQIGSPVFNIKGELIGVVKGKLIKSEEGVLPFFKESSNLISVIPCNKIEELKKKIGKETLKIPGWLGILVRDEERGVVVKRVFPGTPAEETGIRRGDLILRLNDQEVPDVKFLVKKIKNFSPGEKIKLTIQRGDRIIEKEVKLSEMIPFFRY